jgi:hypothetical protein
VIAHEPEPFAGIAFVSRANQAAAFDRISRSSLSWRFSRRSRAAWARQLVAPTTTHIGEPSHVPGPENQHGLHST